MCRFGEFYFFRNAVLFILIGALSLLSGGIIATIACGSAGKESACNAGDPGSIPGVGRSPGEGKGYPLQDSGLENPAEHIVCGVVKRRTLSDCRFSSRSRALLPPEHFTP